MTNFVTVIQTKANRFDVFKFNAETSSRIYPQSREKGITIHIAESNTENDKYAFSLAEKMNANGN